MASSTFASIRRSPQLVVAGFHLVRRSGWRLPVAFAVLDVLNGVAVALELLLIRHVGAQFLDESRGVAVGHLVAFGLVTAGRRTLASVAAQLRLLASERVQWSLTQDVLTVATAARFEEFESPGFQDRLSRAMQAAWGQAWNTLHNVLQVSNGAVATVSLVAVLATVVPELLAPFGVGAVVLLAVAVVQGRLRYEFSYADTPAERERSYLRDALTSRSEGKEVRLFGSRRLLMDRHQTLSDRRLGELEILVRRRVAGDLLANLALAAVLVGVLAAIAVRAEGASLALADAAVAALTAQQLAGRLQALIGSLGALHESALFLDDLTSFLNDRPTGPPDPGEVRPPGDVLVLDDVSYGYPDAAGLAVDGVTLRIAPGEVVAVVGENGSGKSTLAKLAAGLYQPTAGEVRVEGEGATVVTGPLTGLVSAVFQDFARYELTVAENVWLGAPWRANDRAGVVQALQRAGALDLLSGLPDGLQSRLGRRFAGGLDLSLGQWQRLALARAFFSPAPLLVMDEPTASMDPRIEADLFERLGELCAGRGVLLVSHRFSTVRTADRIVVMAAGRIVEEGTHDDLVAAGGVYAALYDLQAARYR